MRGATRQYTVSEVNNLDENARYGILITCPACRGPVDCAEIEPYKPKRAKSSTRRFSFVCTVCSSYGEYEIDASTQHKQRELVSS